MRKGKITRTHVTCLLHGSFVPLEVLNMDTVGVALAVSPERPSRVGTAQNCCKLLVFLGCCHQIR
jgi:hypothetical protein